uniref:Uncharacterized protein n=1 Tax=Oryza barthii TaxID=65489 RepID=A0A0D3FUV7_9ORYZ
MPLLASACPSTRSAPLEDSSRQYRRQYRSSCCRPKGIEDWEWGLPDWVLGESMEVEEMGKFWSRVTQNKPNGPRAPKFANFAKPMGGSAINTGSSPWFDVFGKEFRWGRPATMRSGGADKFDGKLTVYEGPTGAGSMSLESS